MKTKMVFFLSVLSVITTVSFGSTPVPSGDVSGIWTKENSPYLIDGEITIPHGSTLTIEPGVLVEFQGYYALNVQGTLLAVGTEKDTIVFTIHDTTGFSSPDTSAGGWHGIRFINTSSLNDSSEIVYCRIEYGKAVGPYPTDYEGGGVCVFGFSKLTISHSLFTRNIAYGGQDGGIGGAIRIDDSGGIVLSHCTVSGNSAQLGGGIMLWNNSGISITNCTVMNNRAIAVTDLSAGGGICCFNEQNLLIQNSVFRGNTSSSGGGAMNFYESDPLLINNIIAGNHAMAAGGILFNGNTDAVLINNTICDNSVPGQGGGIICHEGSDPILINSILFGNKAFESTQIHVWDDASEPSFYHCTVQFGTAGWTGENNIATDPSFVSADDNAYRLADSSRCIGAGIDSIEIDGEWYYAPATDFYGNPRPDPQGSLPDIGACESPLAVPTAIVDRVRSYPTEFVLHQNYPNPFNPSTVISYDIEKRSHVTLTVYDVLGRGVALLVDADRTPGRYHVEFDGSRLSSGVYLYRLVAGSRVISKNMILLK